MRYILFFCLLGLAAAASAQDADEGKVLFMDHCATCHGTSARGDGPMAAVLSVEPPDLTELADRNSGAFPTDYVVRRVDGREEVLAHGGPMPVFGMILEGESGVVDAPDGSPIFTTAAIVDLTEWLRTIQK